MRIAFYAPLKPPDDPVPSGDREIARLLTRALDGNGARVTVASRLRTRARTFDGAELTRLRDRARTLAQAYLDRIRAKPDARPDVWFTYHLYYKAPDWIGPIVADALAIPYFVAEASLSSRRDHPPWAAWQADARAQLQRADAIFCLTGRDADGLVKNGVDPARLLSLPPFLDVQSLSYPAHAKTQNRVGEPVRLASVGMMRPGNKQASYEALAAALAQLGGSAPDWVIDIAGDGPAQDAVHAAFSSLPSSKVRFHGRLEHGDIATLLRHADLFVWPGVREPFGMVFLEAAAQGAPAIAFRSGGVPDAVIDGRTGVLVADNDTDALAAALSDLMSDRNRREQLGRQAVTFVAQERTLAAARAVLQPALSRVVAAYATAHQD